MQQTAKKDGAPEARLQNQVQHIEHQKAIWQRATVLTKWLWILFWLFIPDFISGIITNENVVVWLPWLEIPGIILGVVSLVIYGVALLKIAPVNHRFQRAGICCLATVTLNVVLYFIDAANMQNVGVLLALISLGIPFYGEYSEYMGYAEILSDVDQGLSQKWSNLWKLFLASLIGAPITIVITALHSILWLLALIVILVAVIAAGILKLVYLYRTAALFREITQYNR